MRHLNAAQRRGSSGASSSGDDDSAPDVIPVNTANPAEIRTDGAGTVYEGERDSHVIEIIDPGQRCAPPAISLEDLGADDNNNVLDRLLGDLEPGADAPSLGAKTESGRRQAPTQQGVNNANARRARAFRAGLVRAVALVHRDFLSSLRQEGRSAAAAGEVALGGPKEGGQESNNPAGVDAAQTGAKRSRKVKRSKAAGEREEWDPLAEGEWHPCFPVQELELATLRKAVGGDAALRRGSGSGSDEEGIIAGLTLFFSRQASENRSVCTAFKADMAWKRLRSHLPCRLPCLPKSLRCACSKPFAQSALRDRVVSRVLVHAGGDLGAQGGGVRRRRAAPRPPQLHRRHEPCRDTTPLAPDAFLAHIRTVSWYKDQVSCDFVTLACICW